MEQNAFTIWKDRNFSVEITLLSDMKLMYVWAWLRALAACVVQQQLVTIIKVVAWQM